MNLAVFLPNWIGDVVMATPAIAALRSHFRQARLVAVGRKYVHGVIAGSPWFDEWLGTQGKGWAESVASTAYRLRKMKADVAILFPNSFRSAFTAYLGGCRRIVGYARDRRSWMLTDRLPPLVNERGRYVPSPVLDAYNHIAMILGTPWPGHQMHLFTSPQDEEQTDKVWAQFGLQAAAKVVLFNPGAAYGSAKLWPSEHFARLAQRLADQDQAHVLVLCGPSERSLARSIVDQAQRRTVHSLAEETLSIGLLKACVRRGDLLVTTDSGPRHFAAAFNKPVVTLFGPTHIAWTETYHPLAIHLQKPVSCGPCQLRICPLDHRCMNELGPEEVYDAVRQLMTRWTWPLPQQDQRKRA